MTSPLTTGLVPHEAGAAEVSRREFQSRLAGIGNLNGKKMTEADKEKKLREACEGFESIFIQKMWQEMRNTLPKTNMLQGREEQFWQSMYDQELAKSMTTAGGIGLADMMYAQLSRNLVSASRSTASSAGGMPSGFTPQAASILPAGSHDSSAVADAQSAMSASGASQGGAGHGDAGQGGARHGGVGHAAVRGGASIPAVYDGIAPVQDVGGSGHIQVLPGGMASAESARAAGLPASQAAQAAGPPEVEQALAALRARQDGAQNKEQHTPPNMNTGLHLARAARFEAGSKLGSRGVLPRTHLAQPNQPGQAIQSGQPMQAAQASFAGQAPESIQPNGHTGPIPPLTGYDVQAGQVSGQAMAGQQAVSQAARQAATGDMQMLMAQSVGTPAAMQAAMHSTAQPDAPAAQAEPHLQKVRYTTNVPPGSRKTSGSAILRSMSADAVGPNSRAGAGLAAYHAQQASQQASQQAAQPPTQVPLTGSAPLAQGQAAPGGAAGATATVTPAPAGGPANPLAGQPMAAQAGMAASGPSAQQARQGMESYGIPPLTATDIRR